MARHDCNMSSVIPQYQTNAEKITPVMQKSTAARRLFFLLDSFMIGGTETQAVELARRFDPERYEVTIGCLRKEGPLLSRLNGSRVRVVEFAMGGGIDSPSGMLAVLRLARFLRKGRFQIVHAHDLWSNMIGVIAGKLARIPVIITSQRDLSHDAWYRTYRRRVLRYLQRHSSMVLANAQAIRDGLISEDHLPAGKVGVIYNGVDLDRFHNAKVERESLFPGMTERKLIVHVGNMNSDVKGHPVLIAAAAKIAELHSEALFVLVGDGPMRAEFENQTESAGVKQSVLFLGRRSDVPQILGACDIAVLPSLAEGLPNAVLEYLAAGLPVVATALGGNLEVIQDGVSGVLIPPHDSVALAAVLVRLLDDPDLASRLAKAGYEHVTSSFSFDRLVAETDQLYTRLLQSES